MPAHPTWHPRMLMHPTRHPRMPHASHTASTYASCTPHGIHVCPTHHTLHPRMPPPHFPHGIHAYPRAPHASSPPHTPRATLTTQTSAPTHACAPTLRAPHIPTCLHHPRHHLPLHRTTLHTTGNAIEHTTPNPLAPIQLNKKLEDMTAALSRAAPNPSQNRLAQSRAKSGRYQPYHISPATEPAGRTYDDPAHNNRTSSGKKGKMPEASARAPFASAKTPMTSPNVTLASYGMDTPLPSPAEATKEPSSALSTQATPFASISTCPRVVTPPLTFPDTAVLAAATTTMQPKAAASPSPNFRTSTPYIAEGWQSLLVANNLIDKYRHIPTSLQFSFNTGIKYITHTFTPPNDESVSLYHDTFQQTITHEFNKGRYEGPFSRQQIESLIGPFQASPISIVPKP